MTLRQAEWSADDNHVVANRVVAGRIIKVHAAPEGFAVDVVLTFEHH